MKNRPIIDFIFGILAMSKHMTEITVGLGIHRPEMVPLMADVMQRHDIIILEEPSVAGFKEMLNGRIPIMDYLVGMDTEYPEYSRGIYRVVRELHRAGKAIYQKEPFLDELLGIHEMFGNGKTPGDIIPGTLQHQVYCCERDATAALLAFYKSAIQDGFDSLLEKVTAFARTDAARFKLRNTLRARSIARRLTLGNALFIEAGAMHYPLWVYLNRLVPSHIRVRPLYLSDRVTAPRGVRHCRYGPGDILTLLYEFHPDWSDPPKENLLAARALIHNRIVAKEEVSDLEGNFYHLENESACIRMVQQLTLEECRRMFSRIRRLSHDKAFQMVTDELNRSRNSTFQTRR